MSAPIPNPSDRVELPPTPEPERSSREAATRAGSRAGVSGADGAAPTGWAPAPSRGVLFVVCLALATVVSAMASLNVALPDIGRATGASLTQLTWIVDAYALTFAALLLPGGALGDRFGRRRVLLVGLTVFAVASAGVLVIDSAPALIALRAVCGVAAAVIMPATLSTITATFPAGRRVQAVATWSGVAGASAILGLVTSGLVLEWFSWQSVFIVSMVLALISLFGTIRLVPESADPAEASKDRVGVVISVIGLVVLVYSIIEAPTHGWAAVRTWGGLTVGVAILVVFVLWELRAQRPLLHPKYFRNVAVSACSASLTLQFFAFFGFIYLAMQYLQGVRGFSALTAVGCVATLPFGLMPAARGIAPKALPRIGPGPLIGGGLLLAAAGMWSLSGLAMDTPIWRFMVTIWVMGLGLGLAMPPATTLITAALPAAQQGVASALNDLTRELGGALGIAVIASVATESYQRNVTDAFAQSADQGKPVPPQVVSAVQQSFMGATHAPNPAVVDAARTAFVSGMSDGLLVGAIVLAAAGVVCGGLLVAHRTRVMRSINDAQ